jgi:SOUL heme-binding protein
MKHHQKKAHRQGKQPTSIPLKGLITAILFALVPAFVTAQDSANAAGSKSNLPSDKYEQPRHTVIEKVGNIEIRQYQPMLLAEVSVEGDRNQAANEGFRVLAGFIFGSNTTQKSISMTSPVTQAPVANTAAASEKISMTSPVTQQRVENSDKTDRWVVSFMMPSEYTLTTLPKPKSDRIRFRMSEPERRAVIRFSGRSSESNLATHRAELEAFVKARNLQVESVPMIAYYDDPFTLPWNRRNEWSVKLKLS